MLMQDVIVKVTMASICGSDMHPYAGRGVPLDHGITFGHEYTGVIVAVGDEVSSCIIRKSQSSLLHGHSLQHVQDAFAGRLHKGFNKLIRFADSTSQLAVFCLAHGLVCTNNSLYLLEKFGMCSLSVHSARRARLIAPQDNKYID